MPGNRMQLQPLNAHCHHKLAVCFLWLIAVTKSSKSDDVLNIVWLAPYVTVDDGIRATFNASTSLPGLALAVNKVRTEGLMPGMRFNVTWLNSDCFAKTSIGVLAAAVRDLTNLPDVILGPPCTTAMQPVADLASYLNIPVFGWMSSDHRLDNKTRASTLVRLMPPLSDLGV
ncbi:atrial natriuretic peptide receptor 3-like [Babylonia areolata]|uniref:atrial natriuretic peptide receptor 3-like n=1 Tax=Babylonia areolata TaxID=304850 RepID=UPI003FCF166D